jgi:beta-glucanase (GH16 family)
MQSSISARRGAGRPPAHRQGRGLLPLRKFLLALPLAAWSSFCLPAVCRAQEVSTPRAADEVVITAAFPASARASGPFVLVPEGLRLGSEAGWIDFELEVPVAGRYRCDVVIEGRPPAGSTVWVEDRIGNPDGRTYDVTAPISLPADGGSATKDGVPLDAGPHTMRLHHSGGAITVRALRFALMRRHQLTPTTHVQRTEGTEWALVWSDEFDGDGVPDPARWTADIGNWGWGNRELQYYTEGRVENARQEGGHLVIEARPGDLGQPWTSARLTTRGKVSFLYGRIEIRARLPVTDGTWAAGWLLGDAYRDEVSWPYCGEIDVMEGVGREIDDASGDGLNHASCHTRAYYFKQGNHISESIRVEDMSGTFHDYAVEWGPDAVRMYVDGRHYYTYDKTGSELSWPFDRPQNLILNLAIGGGMGGAIAADAGAQRLVVDHVRVYGRR